MSVHNVRRGRHPAVGSHVHGQRERLRRHFREHRLRVPPARTRSRSLRRTVARLSPPSTSPSRSTRRARSPALPAPPSPSARPGPLPSRRPGCPTCTLSETAHCRRESSSPTTGTARRHLREHRLRAPAERTRSRSPPRTVPLLPPPRASPSRSTMTCTITSSASTTFTVGQARDLYRHVEWGAPLRFVRDGRHCRRESRSPTTGTARRHLREHRLRAPADHTRSRSPPRTSPVTTPRASPSRSTRRARSPAPRSPPPLPRDSPGLIPVTSTGVPTCTLSATGTLPPGVTFTDNGNGTGTISGTPTSPRYVPGHDHRHERRRS